MPARYMLELFTARGMIRAPGTSVDTMARAIEAGRVTLKDRAEVNAFAVSTEFPNGATRLEWVELRGASAPAYDSTARPTSYPHRRRDGRTVRVTIPES